MELFCSGLMATDKMFEDYLKENDLKFEIIGDQMLCSGEDYDRAMDLYGKYDHQSVNQHGTFMSNVSKQTCDNCGQKVYVDPKRRLWDCVPEGRGWILSLGKGPEICPAWKEKKEEQEK